MREHTTKRRARRAHRPCHDNAQARSRVTAPPFRMTPDEMELLRLHAALAFHPDDAPYLIPLIYGQLELVTPGAVV